VVRRLLRSTARLLIGTLIVIVALIGVGIAALETSWGRDRIRELLVDQANRYLTARLTIGGLDGSVLRGVRLHDIHLSRDSHDLIVIDGIELSYSIRELFQSGTVIRRVRLLKPVVNLSHLPDGRWDLAAIVKRERREGEQSGPGRPISIRSIEVVDGDVQLHGPLDFGAAHAPTRYRSLNATFSFEYVPVRWRLAFSDVSFDGRAPDLSLTKLNGAIGNGPGGWLIEKLTIETPRTALVLDGRVSRSGAPTRLGLTVDANRFAFQEWSGVLSGLRDIAVEGPLQATLSGPLSQLITDLSVKGTGGSASGRVTLDTTVPGWRASGTVDLVRLNLARWLNKPDRPSDLTGHVTFDLALELGRHFPRGRYSFNGRHAMYMNYAADDVRADGQITGKEILIARASGTAYGARASVHDGSIGLDSPFAFRFFGSLAQVDLRRVPPEVPVPRVESALSFEYDLSGRFVEPFVAGHATFSPSSLLGASIGAGTVGTIDTLQTPIAYSGEGEIANVNVRRLGEGFGVDWMQDPRYGAAIAGRFRVDGRGFDTRTMLLIVGGRITHADAFRGSLANADVSMSVHDGTLTASYSGDFSTLDPAVALADQQLQASLTGNATVSLTVRDLLRREVTLDDVDIAGALNAGASTVHGVELERGRVAATVRTGLLSVTDLDVSGPAIRGGGSGVVALDHRLASAFDYQIERADLANLQDVTGINAAGTVATRGRLTGPWTAVHMAGSGSIAQLDAFDVKALEVSAKYDATFDIDRLPSAVVQLDGRGTSLTIAGQQVQETSGTVAINAQQLRLNLRVLQSGQRNGTLSGVLGLRLDEHAVDISEAVVGLGHASWRLGPSGGPVTIRWDSDGVIVAPATFVGGNGDERIGISGTWRQDGAGALRLSASHVFIDAFQSAFDRPTRFGGVLDADLTIRGTRARLLATGTVSVTNGRVERVSYQKLAGRVDYAEDAFSIDLRLDQSPGVWITAVGTVPAALVDDLRPERPIEVAIKSSGINLGLLEGLTNRVSHVSGEIRIDARVIGTSRDPHFAGTVAIERAEFQVTGTGARYKNGRAEFALTRDRIAVTGFRIEDSGGRPLELRGSLGTHELTVGELAVEVDSEKFEILRNEFGRLSIDSKLHVGGRAESPQVTGELTVSSGELRVDEILQRALFQPYATEETAIVLPDSAGILNPWQLLHLNLTLRVPNTLRLIGDNVQLSPGTPIGLGNINLRAAGDLYLYKDPGQPLYVTGSFDSVSGTYAFQGRRFDVDPASAIVFRGDLNPELYVGVTRTISGVQTRVGIIGPMREPELRLTSIPPLDESDILSLIVFNTSTNQLSALQQQELVVRAGALAAGFLATPIISAISNEIGLDILQIEAGNDLGGGAGAKVTVGQEIAPGLVAQFSRQFGSEPYDEAMVEYYLSRIIRLRGTFSDAQTLNARSPFRRVERAGIDLLFFFSF
jgi:autotransporter translocation and assembly factor TamB